MQIPYLLWYMIGQKSAAMHVTMIPVTNSTRQPYIRLSPAAEAAGPGGT
jgi:hypothetical protein